MIKNIIAASVGTALSLSVVVPAFAQTSPTTPAPKPVVTTQTKVNANGAATGKPAMKAGKNQGKGKKTGFKPKSTPKKTSKKK